MNGFAFVHPGNMLIARIIHLSSISDGKEELSKKSITEERLLMDRVIDVPILSLYCNTLMTYFLCEKNLKVSRRVTSTINQ